MASGILRCSKNKTMLSISLRDVPPVETITGLRAFAIFSSKGQSVTSELATLMISIPNSTHSSTWFSSNGVATRTQLARRTPSTSAAVSSTAQNVYPAFSWCNEYHCDQEILMNKCIHIAELELDSGPYIIITGDRPKFLDDAQAAFTSPQWLLAISSTKRSFKKHHDWSLVPPSSSGRRYWRFWLRNGWLFLDEIHTCILYQLMDFELFSHEMATTLPTVELANYRAALGAQERETYLQEGQKRCGHLASWRELLARLKSLKMDQSSLRKTNGRLSSIPLEFHF